MADDALKTTSLCMRPSERELVDRALPYSDCKSFSEFMRSAGVIVANTVLREAAKRGEIEYEGEEERG